jgi:crossover junction endodeoxyribonuclease RuvC
MPFIITPILKFKIRRKTFYYFPLFFTISKKINICSKKTFPFTDNCCTLKCMQNDRAKEKTLTILGVDPGTCITGYGVIAHSPKSQHAMDYGCIRPPAKKSLPQKHLIIFESLSQIMDTYKPDAVAVETQFVYKNVQSALKLGMARAMAMLAATQRGIPIYEYTPKKAKLAVVGQGAASKHQVQKMIQVLFKLPSLPEPEDAADALALALCHIHAIQYEKAFLQH